MAFPENAKAMTNRKRGVEPSPSAISLWKWSSRSWGSRRSRPTSSLCSLALRTLWLTEILAGERNWHWSARNRSEFILARSHGDAQLADTTLSIYSGYRLDVDAEKGLVGECDFILALARSRPSAAASPWLR